VGFIILCTVIPSLYAAIFVHLQHSRRFAFPVFLRVLNDAQGVDPEVFNVQAAQNLDCVLKEFRHVGKGHGSFPGIECSLCSGEGDIFTPAIAQSGIAMHLTI
jgi:hypothetical protein